MSDLVDRLRVSAAPVGKLLQEAADALDAAERRVAELTETLRAVVEISNSQRSREFSDVKKTLAKARALLSPTAAGSAAAPIPASAAARIPASAAAPERPAPVPPPEQPAPLAEPSELADQREDDLISGMYKEIKNLLRHSA
jgi:hypothetical protein